MPPQKADMVELSGTESIIFSQQTKTFAQGQGLIVGLFLANLSHMFATLLIE
jgi:hypothetical protein